MHTSYTLFLPDGTEIDGVVDLDAEPSFQALDAFMRPFLDGAELEHVTVWHEGAYTDMFVDEIGLLKGLPRNDKATAIYRASWLTHQDPDADPETLAFIAGPAVLFHRKVWL